MNWIASLLVWLSAPTDAVEVEQPRCAAAVAVARSSMVRPVSDEDESGEEIAPLIEVPSADDCPTCKKR
jgi:hypothetical protein